MNENKSIIPKYYSVKNNIIKEIKKGKYPAKSKLPSIREMIRKYNISDTTAKRVINELIKDGFIYTLPGKGCFISEKISTKTPWVRQLNKTIFFIMPEMSLEFYNKVLQGILDISTRMSYKLEIHATKHNYLKETKLLGRCLEEKPSGVIFSPAFYNKKYTHLFTLHKSNIPVILMGNDLIHHKIDFVGINDFKGARNAVRYLIKSGHKKIVFVGGGLNIYAIRERFRGYLKALEENKIKYIPELALTENKRHFSSPEEEGYYRIKEFLKKKIKFTAVFAKDDKVAFGVLRALKEKNIKTPDDVSVIGFDDIVSKYFEVPLTTVAHNPYKMGYYAGKRLIEKIENNDKKIKRIILPAKIILRDSVKKIKSGIAVKQKGDKK